MFIDWDSKSAKLDDVRKATIFGHIYGSGRLSIWLCGRRIIDSQYGSQREMNHDRRYCFKMRRRK